MQVIHNTNNNTKKIKTPNKEIKDPKEEIQFNNQYASG